MGQRTQALIEFEHKGEKFLFVFHNQWGYGKNLLNFIAAIEEQWEMEHQQGLDFDTEMEFAQAVMNIDTGDHGNPMTYQDKCPQGYGFEYYFNLSKGGERKECDWNDSPLTSFNGAGEFLKCFDNNNGWAYIVLNDDGTIGWDIIAGPEDQDHEYGEYLTKYPPVRQDDVEYLSAFHEGEKAKAYFDDVGFLNYERRINAIELLDSYTNDVLNILKEVERRSE